MPTNVYPLSHVWLEEFFRAYLACLAWCQVDMTTGESGDTDDLPFTAAARQRLGWEALGFVESNLADLTAYEDRMATKGALRPAASAGHDFALNRNGHGAGFWDRGLGVLGDRLSAAAKVYGEVNIWSLVDPETGERALEAE